MADDTRCMVYNQALDTWIEGIGAECSSPDARPIDTDTPAPTSDENTGTLGAPQPDAQASPPPAQPPSTTSNGTSTATPGGGPNADPGNTPPSTQSGTDPTPLSQQYFRPLNPLPDYGVQDNLLRIGVSPNALAEATADVQHNEPEPGQPHPQFGLNNRMNPPTVADPVDPFTGQFGLDITDVSIPSRGFPLELRRRYRSGPVYFGPWGYNWDHNFNSYVRELNDNAIAVWTGALNEDLYRLSGPDSYEPPIGVFLKLERIDAGISGTEYHVTDRDGMEWIYARPPAWARQDCIPLVRLEDRSGNRQQVTYDAEGRVALVQDDAGRFLQFNYGDCGLLESLQDSAGRVWRYDHAAEVEHLVAVTTPATTEYPQGTTTQYDYDATQTHPALQHNLIRIVDANGNVAVENTYGNDPLTDDFCRIVHQTYGDFDAEFCTTELQVVPRIPDVINAPTLRVQIVDPGYFYVHTYNFRGDLLDQRFRLTRDGTNRLVTRTFLYDAQGNPRERWEANGLGLLNTYDFANPDPRARGNLLKREMVAPPTQPAPSRIMALMTYEPQFHRLKSVRDATGAITTFLYDYEQLIVASKGELVAIEYPVVTLPDGTTQAGVERFRYDDFGQMVEHTTCAGARHLFTYGDTGPIQGYLLSAIWDAGGAAESQIFGYDAFGHRSVVTDGLGNRFEKVVNALGLVEKTLFPEISEIVDEARFFYTATGFLRRAEWPCGTYADDVLSDPFFAHEFLYDPAVRFLLVAPRGVNAGGKLGKEKRMSPVWSNEELPEGGKRHRSCTRKP